MERLNLTSGIKEKDCLEDVNERGGETKGRLKIKERGRKEYKEENQTEALPRNELRSIDNLLVEYISRNNFKL